MSLTPPVSYPGVYIQELEPSVRPITGVRTSITAFIGRALRGPIDSDPLCPVLIHSSADFDRIFRGLWQESEMSYAIHQFFLNGGADALIIRVVNGASSATFNSSNISPPPTLPTTISAPPTSLTDGGGTQTEITLTVNPPPTTPNQYKFSLTSHPKYGKATIRQSSNNITATYIPTTSPPGITPGGGSKWSDRLYLQCY